MKAAQLHRGDSLKDAALEQARHLADSGVDAYQALSKKTRKLGKTVDGFVHQHPWMTIGAAAGAGLLAGLLLSRRRA